jgi:hypothetical protein
MLLNVDWGRELVFEIGEALSSDNAEGVLIRENRVWLISTDSTGVGHSIGVATREFDRLNGLNLERHDVEESTGSVGREDFQRRNLIFCNLKSESISHPLR